MLQFQMFKTWLVARLSHDERGATMVEYGLMVALIAVVALGAVVLLGTGVRKGFNDTQKCINDNTTCPPAPGP